MEMKPIADVAVAGVRGHAQRVHARHHINAGFVATIKPRRIACPA